MLRDLIFRGGDIYAGFPFDAAIVDMQGWGSVDFPYFSRHLIMSKMKRRGLYATHQIYGRI